MRRKPGFRRDFFKRCLLCFETTPCVSRAHSGFSHWDIGVHAPVGGHCLSPGGQGWDGGGGLGQNDGPNVTSKRLLHLACVALRAHARSSAFPSPVYSASIRPMSLTTRYVEIMGPVGEETPTEISSATGNGALHRTLTNPHLGSDSGRQPVGATGGGVQMPLGQWPHASPIPSLLLSL